jgi:type II secretory pathway predicted ATPase ExeA
MPTFSSTPQPDADDERATAEPEDAPGAADPRLSSDPVGRFTVPRLPGLPSIKILREALRQAVDHRQGVVVVAPMGYGKSEGAHAARARLAEIEHELARSSPTHRRRRVVYVNLRTAKTKRQLLIDLLQRARPGMKVSLYHRGDRKHDDQLRDDLYAVYARQGVAALIVDDAQRLSDAGLELLRDLMAAREEDPHRTVTVDGVDGTAAVGLGVVLIGTPGLAERVVQSGETHGRGRWAFEHTVPALPEAYVSRVYAAVFPGFAPHIAQVTRAAWERFIADHVVKGRVLPIRLLTTHAREYFARLYDHTQGQVCERSAAPFDRALFLETLRAVEWDEANGRTGGLLTPGTDAQDTAT